MIEPVASGDARVDVARPETADVLPAHRFDEARLLAYLERHVEGVRGPLTVRQFRGGQSNPTYLLDAGGKQLVLRRKPPGKLLPSAHAVDREYRAMTALRDTGVPVPRTYMLCEDPDVVGTIFYVMDFVPGRIFRDPSAPDVSPAERRAIFDSLNDVMARLHRVDPRAVGLDTFGRAGNYFARQIHRWSEQYRASETEKIEAMEQLMTWLPGHIPEGDEATVVHGDYRLGNTVVHPTEPRIAAVLDWELCTIGHPLADLAYNCLPFRLQRVEADGLVGLDLRALGIPSEEEYVAAYCRRTGRTGIPRWDFYVAFAMFRIAAISQGIMGRVIAGTANDPHARLRGERARPLAEAAWALVENGTA